MHPPGGFVKEIDLMPQLQQLGILLGGIIFISTVAQMKRKKHQVE